MGMMRAVAGLEEIMKETGALLSGHFLLTSGLHSDRYMQCALLLQHPRHAAFAGEELAKRLAPLKPEVVWPPPWEDSSSAMRWPGPWTCPFCSANARRGAWWCGVFPIPVPCVSWRWRTW